MNKLAPDPNPERRERLIREGWIVPADDAEPAKPSVVDTTDLDDSAFLRLSERELSTMIAEARDVKQFGAAGQLSALRAKLRGLLVDKVKIDAMAQTGTPELLARILQSPAARAMLTGWGWVPPGELVLTEGVDVEREDESAGSER